MATPLAASDPTRIGDYALVSRLGEGGMGVVYLGQTSRGTPVAVKTIRDVHTTAPEFRERFRRELNATLRVNGEHVAKVSDADLDAAPPYFVSEFIPGPTLEERIEQSGPLSNESLTATAGLIASGIAELHAADVSHRDLSPRNIILSPDGPKIIDLGIAHVRDASQLTATGWAVGTPGWMSPEQVRGQTVGPESDIFAWGTLVLYAGTGYAPFGHGRAEAVLYRIVHETPTTDELDGSLVPFVHAALAKDPEARPLARELAEALDDQDPEYQEAIKTLPMSDPPTGADDTQLLSSGANNGGAKRNRRRGIVGSVIAAVVALLALGVLANLAGEESDEGDSAGSEAFPQEDREAQAEDNDPFNLDALGGDAEDGGSADADAFESEEAPADAYGSDPVLDRFWDDCERGDFAACDELWEASPPESDYERFASTCGERNDPVGSCANVYRGGGASTEEGEAYGTDATLDEYWAMCDNGLMIACDTLYRDSPSGSEYEMFGATCGYRITPASERCR